MSDFIGKWVDDKNEPRTGFESWMDKAGVNDEEKKKWSDATTFLEYKREGEVWVCSESTDAMPGEVKVYRFKSLVPFEEVELDGSTFKATIEVVSDSEIQESGYSGVYGDFHVTRKVEGNQMKVTTKSKGMEIENVMKRM